MKNLFYNHFLLVSYVILVVTIIVGTAVCLLTAIFFNPVISLSVFIIILVAGVLTYLMYCVRRGPFY